MSPRHYVSRDVRREEIISLAVRLWAAGGYHATSIADLCRAADIGRGALYYHISSKEEILFEIHNRFVDPMLEFGHELLGSSTPPREALILLSRRLLRTVADYRDHVAVFFREMRALSPERLEAVRAKRDEFDRIVQAFISRGIAEGVFAPDTPARLARLAFLGMHNYSYTWFRKDDGSSPEEIADAFMQIFLLGIEKRTP